MSGPLAGVRVVEVGHHIPAPYAAMILADLGAEVIKIVRPGRPDRRDPAARLFDRDKTPCGIDLEDPTGQAAARSLIAAADVFLENHRPGALERLGLGAARLRAADPRLVHASITAYGTSGPDRDLPGWDSLVAARTGLPDDQGVGGRPTWVTQPVASYGAALLAVLGILAALHQRERTGRGQRVETSLLAGALMMQMHTIVEAAGLDRTPNTDPQGANPLYRLYRCADDRWLFLAIGNPVFVTKLARAIDAWDLVTEPEYANAPWGIAPEAQPALKDRLKAAFATRPRDEWLALLDEHDVPCAPVGTAVEYLDDPQARHTGAVVDRLDPVLGPTKQIGRFIDFDVEPPAGTTGPRPGASPDPEGRPESSPGLLGPPLAGLRVVDLSGYIAGSFGPRLLADLGADVIKVEARDGDPFRQLAGGFLTWNRGKRSLVIDLKQPGAQKVARRLLGWADVIVENFRPGVAGRLGVDGAAARSVNPRIIYCSVPGYGSIGPYAAKPAFDPLLQARSGAMAKQGGTGHPPVFLRPAISDYGAGALNAIAVLAALVARDRTGRGRHVETSLTTSCLALQAADFIEYPGRPPRLDGGPDTPGPATLNRLYPTADGWIHVTCRDVAAWSAFLDDSEVAALRPPPAAAWEGAGENREPEREAWLEKLFTTRSTDEWQRRLSAAGVPAAAARSLGGLLGDPQVVNQDLVTVDRHPHYGPIRQIAGVVRYPDGSPPRVRVAPLLGEHTDEILDELGFAADDIAGLHKNRVVSAPMTI